MAQAPTMIEKENATSFEPHNNIKANNDLSNGDEALKVIQSLNDGEVVEIDSATNKRLLRIIDTRLLPMMCLIYGIQFLDKLVLSYAAVMGMTAELGMTGSQYSWLAGVFYFGYLAWEYPTNRLMQRLPLAKYSAFCIVMWGITQCCHAGIVNYSGAVAARFFLGAFEAAVTPGFALITAQWYTKEEQSSRAAIWFSFNGIAQTIGGFLAYGIIRATQVDNSSSSSWRWLYLATGILTVILGVVFWWFMPDNQLNARWMVKEDRVLALHRIRGNQQGIGNKHFKRYQLVEALQDPMSWAFAIYACVTSIGGGGLSGFFSQMVIALGYDTAESFLLGTPAGAMLALTCVLCGYLGGRLNRRLLVSSIGLWLSIMGMLLMVCLPLSHPVGRLIGYYFCWSMITGFITLLSLIGSNVAGYTKKTTVAAKYLIGYCAGYIIGPQMFQAKDAPQYRSAEIVMIGCWFVGILDLYFIAWYYSRQNRAKAAVRAAPGYVAVANQEWLDLTDKENTEFVYIL